MGFFTYLKDNDYPNAFITIYEFLKQDRISLENEGKTEKAAELRSYEYKLGKLIANLV